MGPMTRTVREEYRYAKLANNPLTFVVKADKFDEVFAKATELRDPRLGRFESSEGQEVTVSGKGQSETKLTRKKGNKNAKTDAEKQDRWYLALPGGPVLADDGKVNEFLTLLSGLEARSPLRDMADAAKPEFGIGKDGFKVTIKTREKRPDDQ